MDYDSRAIICFLVAHEDIIPIRKIFKAEVMKYEKLDYLLSIPLSPNSEFPITHWFHFEKPNEQTHNELQSVFKVLNINNMYCEFCAVYNINNIVDIYNYKGLKSINTEARAVAKANGWDINNRP